MFRLSLVVIPILLVSLGILTNACTNTGSTDCDQVQVVANIYGTSPAYSTGSGAAYIGAWCQFCVSGGGSFAEYKTDLGYYKVVINYFSNNLNANFYSPQGVTGSWVETYGKCLCWGASATVIAFLGGSCGY